MALRYQIEHGWEYEPPSSCYVGGGLQGGTSSGSGSGSSQSTQSTYPQNYQNQSFVNQTGATAGELGGIAEGLLSGNSNILGGLSPISVNGTSTSSSNNPLVAPVTAAQNTTLGGIGNLIGALPNTLGGAFNTLTAEMSPNFASNLATSPQTMAAEQAAIAPIAQQFATQAVPGLQGSFTQAGQRVGTNSGMGSSAFDNAFAAAQGNEMATEAATTGAIANNAYQTGLNITANAPAQMGSLTSTELNDMISGLNAQALPQLTQQYGISAGTQLYQQQMATILQALGLNVQGEQPVLGYTNAGQSSSNQQQSNQSVNASGSVKL